MPHPDDEVLGAFDSSTFRPEWTTDGHVSEESIHAWLDGAMDRNDSNTVAQHVRSCASCDAAVAEARGFIAASARIVNAAEVTTRSIISRDDVRRASARIVAGAPMEKAKTSSRWRTRFVAQIAAGLMLMIAGVSYMGNRDRASDRTRDSTRDGMRDGTRDSTVATASAAVRTPASPKPVSAATPAVPKPDASLPTKRALPEVAATPPAGRAVADVATTTLITVSGRVTDGGRPLASASVSVPGSALGVVTDSLGQYTLRNVPVNATALLARRIGYTASSLPIASGSLDSTTVNFELTPSVMALSQVVVSSARAFPAPRRSQCLVAVADSSSGRAPMLRMLRGPLPASGALTLTLVGWPTRDARTDAKFDLDAMGTLTGRGVSGSAVIVFELHADDSAWFGTVTETLGAIARDANARDVNVRDTNIRDTNIRNTNIRNANIRDTSLRSANVRTAIMRREEIEFMADTSSQRCSRNN